MAELGVTLEEGVEYEWFIYVIPNPVERTGDLIASATVRYQPLSAELNQLKKTTTDKYSFYATAGYWYDSIHSLAIQRQQNPNNADLKQQHIALITQANMPKVVDFIKE